MQITKSSDGAWWELSALTVADERFLKDAENTLRNSPGVEIMSSSSGTLSGPAEGISEMMLRFL